MALKSLTMRRLSFLLSVALLMLAGGLGAKAQTQNWQLIWSDNFAGPAGSAPNPNNWTLQEGLTPDGAQSYNCTFGQTTNGCNPANPNVYLDGNNHLIIKALAAAGAPNGVTSGRIFTSNAANTSFMFSTKYGRIEAQMVLPAGSGNQGVWPAFWMLGTNIGSINWPSCGEMDIMEYIGAANETQIYSTLHGQAYADTGLGVRDTLSGGWSGTHTFGAIWSPNQISFYVDDISNIYGTISADDIMANQSWNNGGLAAWPFNNPMFIILNLNMGGPFPGNVSAATTYPQVLQVNYVNVYQATPPAAPTNLTGTATSQSQVALNWTASTSSDVTYNVYRSQVSGVAPMSQAQPNPATLPQINQTLIANNITATTYTDANLSPGQTYYYTVTASGEYSGETAAAAQAKVTTLAAGNVGTNGGAIYVSAAGYSGTGNYIINSLVSGGFTNAFTQNEITSGVTNPAPQDVYHSERWGPSTWTIAHLTPGGSYNVRMHFAESAWTAAGQREFNVLIDGQQVLTNFDIFATAGAQNTVITETIHAVADRNGVIYLQLVPGAADQPEIRALDVTPTSGGVVYGEASGSTTYIAIDSGGAGGEVGTRGTFEADVDAGSFGLPSNPLTQGGATNTTTQTISTTGVTNPAPAEVYQTERYGGFGYFFTGLVPNSTYTVRLHLAEGVLDYNAAGLREFNVAVNGNQVLTNYDIYANAGAIDQAVVPQVTGTSDEHGLLSVQFSSGYDDQPSVRGIEVIQSSTPPVAATPGFSPGSGTYTSAQTVTISDATSGAKIYYTTNGTTPTTSSTLYSGPITVSASETVEAIATATGYTTSSVGSAAYTISTPTAATPTFSPAAGTYSSAQTVTISDTTSGAKIYYTTNGTTPTTASAVYSGPITVSSSETLEAIATATGYTTSGVGSAAYTISTAAATPTFSPAAGTYTSAQTVTISDATSGAKIYYTTNGSTPTTSSTLYSGPITVSASETVEAIATATGHTTSGVGSATYTISTSSGMDVLDINTGGATVGSYVADEDFSAGTESSTTATISLSKVTNPAPEGVYQSQRFGNFTYTLPGFAAGSTYLVRLHFDEFYWTAAGKREFNVLINGTQVLTDFDIFATAGGEDIAVVEQFNAVANASGQIVIQFVSVIDNAEINGIEIQTSAPTTDIKIDSGGAASSSWLADEDFNTGSESSTTATINTSLVTNPAPQTVYQTERFGDFTYTIPGLTAGASYTVNLNFAEIYWTAAGKREFNVLINGTQVLTNFDVFAAAGGEDIAIVKSFTATANSSGAITIQFTTGAADLPKVSGIEVVN
jgi:beta-glucanase (GH16 family)